MTKSLKAFTWLLLLDLFVRSIDYVSGGDVAVPDDNLAIPEVWGITGLVTSFIILVGLLARRGAVLKFGTIVAFAVYLMVSIQLFEISMLPYPWPPEDPRRSVSTLVFGLLWLLVAVTVWWREYLNRAAEKEALRG